MKVSKSQLRRIIKEEKNKLQEQEGDHDGLYVNLDGGQLLALDALEESLYKCVEKGLKEEDIMDTVQNALNPDRHLTPKPSGKRGDIFTREDR